ncbi:UbiA family prenyltransferase [Candidatus Micrarchaeota archaeon]|nr:UbiA family prenyltransferase [Candidatus Micrarchaeota archaeon]
MALSALFCAYGMTLQFGLPFTLPFAIMEFSAPLSLYSMNRYMELKQDLETYPIRTNFIKNKMHLFMLATLFFYALALILSFLQNTNSFIFILLTTFSMTIYGLHIGNFRLKDILFLKNIFLGIVWSASLVVLPQIFFQATISSKTIYYIILVGSLCAINTIIFDLRDVQGDKKNNVMTAPVIFGEKNTKRLLNVMTAILLLFSLALYINLGKEYLIFTLTSLYTLLVISRIDVEDIKIVTELYADAFLALLGFFSVLLRLVFV